MDDTEEEESIIDDDMDEREELDHVSPILDRKEYAGVPNTGSGSDDGATRSPPIDGLPRLKLKPSANFGKPFGAL